MPRLRPPFPAQEGLWGKPTVINNVETLAMVPWILRHGPAAFAALAVLCWLPLRRSVLAPFPLGLALLLGAAATWWIHETRCRNIWQAREIKKGLPAFQVGPTCYRGLWIVDGAFILEAATIVGVAQTRLLVYTRMCHPERFGHHFV